MRIRRNQQATVSPYGGPVSHHGVSIHPPKLIFNPNGSEGDLVRITDNPVVWTSGTRNYYSYPLFMSKSTPLPEKAEVGSLYSGTTAVASKDALSRPAEVQKKTYSNSHPREPFEDFKKQTIEFHTPKKLKPNAPGKLSRRMEWSIWKQQILLKLSALVK